MNRFLSAVFAFTIATSALAAAPGGVLNLQAKAQNDGTVLITWDPADGGNIAYYRVYYSANSILESGGAYDDFEETEGSEPEYVFKDAIPAEGLYLAVMAVNIDGDESEYFMEEIQILPVENPDAEAPTPPSPEPTPPLPTPTTPPAPEESGSLALLSAESIAPDSVRLTFSAPIQVRPKSAATAFRITKAGGEVLVVRTLQGEGNTVTLVTEMQHGGVVYQVQLTDALRTELGVTFDEASKAAFFTGTGDPPPVSSSSVASSSSASAQPPLPVAEPPLPPSPAPAPQAPQGIQNITGLRLRVSPGANGTFHVTGEWDLASVSTKAAFLLVGQSFDAGKSFVSPTMVPANATQVNVQNVPAGHFGLLVQVMDAQGTLSSGVFETAWLGKNMPPPAAPAPVQPTPIPAPVPAPVLPPVSAQLPLGTPTQANGLPQSGMGFLAASLALTGMAVGWQRIRMPKKVAA